MKPVPPEVRFWKRVVKAGDNDCWLWIGGNSGNGYGRFRLGGQRDPVVPAHTFSYLLHGGDVPNGHVILHTCDARGCVNPKHLYVADHRARALKAVRQGRMKGLFVRGFDVRRKAWPETTPKPPKATPSSRIDLSGMRFGRLVVQAFSHSHKDSSGGQRMWKCLCDCGSSRTVPTSSLRKGNTRSCGCLQRDKVSQVARTHGASGTAEHDAWMRMHSRCNNPRSRRYARYGGRGIRVAYESFQQFLSEVGLRPSSRHSIDRIDNDGDYAPGNCKWSLPSEQQNNRSCNVRLELDGSSHTAAEWARIVGLNHETLRYRIRRGWPVDCALLVPHFDERKSIMDARSNDRKRDSPRARKICFDTHKWCDDLGYIRLTCHLNKCVIDPVRDKWRADHIRRYAEGGEDTPENLWPICERCDREEKAPKDTSEIAKGRRASDRHFGVTRSKGSFRNPRFRKKVNGEVVER